MALPASQCGLKQRCDAHTEEDGPNELTGGPLVKANTHGLSKEERHCDSSTKTCQVVLQGQATDCCINRFQSNSIRNDKCGQLNAQRSTRGVVCLPVNPKTRRGTKAGCLRWCRSYPPSSHPRCLCCPTSPTLNSNT